MIFLGVFELGVAIMFGGLFGLFGFGLSVMTLSLGNAIILSLSARDFDRLSKIETGRAG